VLFIARPDRDQGVDRAQAFLNQRRPEPADVKAFLANLMLQVLDEGVPDLRARAPAADAMTFKALVQAMSRSISSPAAELFVEILEPFLPAKEVVALPTAAIRQAFASGDRGRARRALLSLL
jgi:hypothetical protein